MRRRVWDKVSPWVMLTVQVLLGLGLSRPALAQSREERLAHARAVAESSLGAAGNWSQTGAVIGGVAGGIFFGGAFYKFTHRDGAPNNKTALVGGTLIGAAFGATTCALAGAFIGALFPKHRASSP